MLILIATTMAVAGLLTAGANTAGEIYDKKIIDDSLNTMQSTVSTLQDKAEEETDPVKKQEKLLHAQNLNETETKLRDLNEKFYKMNLKKEAVGLGRSLISPIKPNGMIELPKVVETVKDALAVADTSVQTINSIASAQTKSTPTDARTALWVEVADTNDECEIQIMIAKARQLTKEASAVKNEATKMADYYRQEEQNKLSSREVEDKLAEVVKESTTLQEEIKKGIWDYMDEADLQIGNNNSTDAKTSGKKSQPIEKNTDTREANNPEITKETPKISDEKKDNLTKEQNSSKNRYTREDLEQMVIEKFNKAFPKYKVTGFADLKSKVMNEQGISCRGSGMYECNYEGIFFNIFRYDGELYTKEDYDNAYKYKMEEAEIELDTEIGYDMRHKSSKYGADYYGESVFEVNFKEDFWTGMIEYYCYPYNLQFEGYSKNKSTVQTQLKIFKELFDVIGKCE